MRGDAGAGVSSAEASRARKEGSVEEVEGSCERR